MKKDTREFKEKETDVMGLKGKDAAGLEEKPEVCYDPSLFRNNAILTSSEKGKGRKGFGRWNKGKETEQVIKTGKDEKAPDQEIPPPVPTLQPLPKAGGNERPTHKGVQTVGSRTTNEPSPRPLPSAGSTFPSSSLFINQKPTD